MPSQNDCVVAIKQLLEHMEVSMDKLLRSAEELDAESFLARRAGMTSIRDLFVHLMDAEDYWLGSVLLNEKRQKFTPEKYENPETLRQAWNRIHERTKRLVAGLTEEFLAEKRTAQWEKEVTLDVATVFWHLVLHEAHHRGQICFLMREQGHEPPEVGMIR